MLPLNNTQSSAVCSKRMNLKKSRVNESLDSNSTSGLVDSSVGADASVHFIENTQRRKRSKRPASEGDSQPLPGKAPTMLCIGLSDIVDGALARVADVILDCMTFGKMEDTCHQWTNVPATPCKFF
ncbi:hypothetical protein ACHAW5_009828 [Stephanodiscus triporus]|uniref:Uncharacterized protein n=1 Tax=Stephanodiscus triporus TaxID=2934178 RepID=A0ABD3PNA2_9STRA